MIEVKSFRHAVCSAISDLRSNWYQASGYKHFPSDKEIADFLSISPQAFSNLWRGCSSASGVTFIKLLNELTSEQVQKILNGYSDCLNADINHD